MVTIEGNLFAVSNSSIFEMPNVIVVVEAGEKIQHTFPLEICDNMIDSIGGILGGAYRHQCGGFIELLLHILWN